VGCRAGFPLIVVPTTALWRGGGEVANTVDVVTTSRSVSTPVRARTVDVVTTSRDVGTPVRVRAVDVVTISRTVTECVVHLRDIFVWLSPRQWFKLRREV
jgi:hypothetical protein